MKLFEEPKLEVILFGGRNILLESISGLIGEGEENDTPKA